jgi:uncharacterized protein YutE (UPF0331/DUF86 family)
MTGMYRDRIADRKIAEHRDYSDNLSLLQQLGVIPPRA